MNNEEMKKALEDMRVEIEKQKKLNAKGQIVHGCV